MELDEKRLEAIPPGIEPGMNFISLDFEIVMVNRTNERLYAKSAVALLGKKCYQEFEKRDEPCPHCPGRRALETGEAHETETMGLRDDGTQFAARIRAHPVVGPDNQPTGFIEVVEDITEQKRVESLSNISADLRAILLTTQNVHKALRWTLEAALRVEGIDLGCVFLVDLPTGEHSLVYQQGVPPECLEAFAGVSRGEPLSRFAAIAGVPRALEVVPILHRGEQAATLVAGASTYPEIPPTLRAGLQNLGAATGYAISRIRAEQSRGDAVADLEALIAVTPVPTWVVDTENRITLWNAAAERLFGWRAAEVVDCVSPFGRDFGGQDIPPASGRPPATVLAKKDGMPVEVRLFVAPFRDVVGNSSTLVVMAEDLTVERQLANAEHRLVELEAALGRGLTAGADDRLSDNSGTGSSARVLIVDSNQPWGEELAGILSELGYAPMRCSSVSETAVILADAEAEAHPFVLAVVDLVLPAGSSGLAQAAVLRGLGLTAPVVVSSDADVRGFERHGIAGVIKRPFEAGAVEQAIKLTLQDQG